MKQEDAEVLASRIEACRIMSPQEVAQNCDLVFVTTPDSVIMDTVQALQWRPENYVVHCSGATDVAALQKAQLDGAKIGGVHPLQTFGDPLVAMESLPGSTITIEAAEPLGAILNALADRLGCVVNRLPPGTRPLYHAAAGYTSQFINVLFQEACNMWRTWGGNDKDAVQAMMPLAQGTLAAIASGGIGEGMPGPVSRGDVISIEKHLAAIESVDPSALRLYIEMCERTVRIALECGRIDDQTAARFRSLFAKYIPAEHSERL